MGVTASQRRVIANMVPQARVFPDVTARCAASVSTLGRSAWRSPPNSSEEFQEARASSRPTRMVGFSIICNEEGCGVERVSAKQKRVVAAAIGLALPLTTSVSAGGGGGIVGATEPTQILNNVELGIISAQEVQAVAQPRHPDCEPGCQIANQIQQIQNMVTNTLNIPNQVWGQIQQEIAPLLQVVQQGQAIAYTMANVGQQFQVRFPDFNNWMNQNFGAQNFMQSYRQWYTTQRDAISGALQVANLQAGQFRTRTRSWPS